VADAKKDVKGKESMKSNSFGYDHCPYTVNYGQKMPKGGERCKTGEKAVGKDHWRKDGSFPKRSPRGVSTQYPRPPKGGVGAGRRSPRKKRPKERG